MIAGAIYEVLNADTNVTDLLSDYEFTTGNPEPAIFTSFKIFEDAMRPAILIIEDEGTSGGVRGQRGGDQSAEIRIFGNRDASDLILRDLATAVWRSIDRSTLAVSGFDSNGVYADIPRRIEDGEGFPVYVVDIRVILYESYAPTSPATIDVPPTIIPGFPFAGDLLEATGFVVSGSPTPSEKWTWYKDDGSGGPFLPIPNSNAPTYQTDISDDNVRWSSVLEVENAFGSDSAQSNIVTTTTTPIIGLIFDTTIAGGASGVGNLVLPFAAGPTVDWGDGTIDNLNTHTYAAPSATQEVKISDAVSDWRYSAGGDKDKLISFNDPSGLVEISSSAMFDGCSNLTTWSQGNSTVTTTSFVGMFRNCISLTALDMSSWDTSGVNNMQFTFFNCTSLITLDVSSWNVSNVNSMNSIFRACSSLITLDVSSWNVGNVNSMIFMFFGCSSLVTLDVSSWNTSNVNSLDSVFRDCSLLILLDVSNWDVSNVSDADFMFDGCSSLSIVDVSGWNTANLNTARFMFQECSSVITFAVSGWDVSSLTNATNMFNLSSLSQSDYDLLLDPSTGWPSQVLQTGVPFSAGNAKYGAGAPATGRGILVNPPNSWTVTDGGPA